MYLGVCVSVIYCDFTFDFFFFKLPPLSSLLSFGGVGYLGGLI